MAKKKDTAPAEIKTEFRQAEIQAKTSLGLSKEQALEVLRSQAAHDATNPHDDLPEVSAETTGE